MHLLLSLKESSTDVRLLWTSVFLRMASFGLTNQVLTLFLKSIGISESAIGVFMTLTLVGDTFISYLLTWYADTIGRRLVMIFGTAMMFAAGCTFAYSDNFHVLLLAAILGVISPSGDETGPFKSVEEASIAHLTPHAHRPEVFAFHGLFATAGSALGAITSGLVVDHFHLDKGWEIQHCYRLIFVIYAFISLLKCLVMLFLSRKCEVDYKEEVTDTTSLLNNSDITQGDTGTEDEAETASPSGYSGLSSETKYLLPRFLVIFMLDSLGYGFMPSAWVVYYFKIIFTLSATSLGALFFFTNAIDSISSLPSAYLAKALGPVKAILCTQAPSAVFFLLIAFTSSPVLASVLLILYNATATMDVVPRQVLLTSVFPHRELTKVMGIVNIGKTFARCIGPVFTGRLAEHGYLYTGFIINGVATLLADFILGYNFLLWDHEILAKQGITT